MRIFVKLCSYLVMGSWSFYIKQWQIEQKKEYWLFVFVDTVHRLIYHQLGKIQRILCRERDFIPN